MDAGRVIGGDLTEVVGDLKRRDGPRLRTIGSVLVVRDLVAAGLLDRTAASPITAFVIGPADQSWVIPFMTDDAGAATIGSWFGTGPDRGMALIFIIAGLIALLAAIAALNSRAYKNISSSYAETRPRRASSEEVKGT